MTVQLLLAFVLFAFATARHARSQQHDAAGLGRELRLSGRRSCHILGISVGLGVMVLAMGLGLGGMFKAWPVLHDLLRWVGGAYLLWLAWKIATAKGISDKDAGAKPMTFLGAAAFPMGQSQGLGHGPDGGHHLHAGGFDPGGGDRGRDLHAGRRAVQRRLGGLRPGHAPGSSTARRCCAPST